MKRTILLIILLYSCSVIFAKAKNYSELPNPKKTNVKAWAKTSKPLYVSFVNKDIRYAKEVPPSLPKEINFWGETAWRGERLSAQLLLWSGSGASEVKIRVSDLETSSGQKLKAENCTVGFVRYIMSDSYGKDGCAARRSKDFDSVLIADIIDYKEITSIKAKSVQPVWLSFSIPPETPTGKYKGFITISAKELSSPITFTTNIFVRNHVLPPPSQWSFHLDMWQNPLAVARHHNVAPWSAAHFDAMRPCMKILAQSGQKSITIPITNQAIDGAMPDEFESMLTFTKRVNSTWSIDYTKFDMWAEFMMGLGVDKELSCYVSAMPLQQITYFDQANMSVKTQSLNEKEYYEFITNTLTLLAQHLKEKEWFDRTYICTKESGKERLRKLTETIKKVDKAYKVSYFGNYFSDVEASVARYSISQSLAITSRQKDVRAQANRRLCFYTPCSDAVPATYVFSPSAEAAWIGWYAAANGFDGYTRQAYNSWAKRPLQDARTSKFPAGYYSMAYPDGRSSIRMERLVEGIQDFEKIKILQQQFTKSNDVIQREILQKIMQPFTLENLKEKSAAEIIEQARIQLNSL